LTDQDAPTGHQVVHLLGAATLGLAVMAALSTRRDARTPARRPPPDENPARALHASAALLAASVLADSGLEHYRAGFENKGMFAPLLTSALVLAAATASARGSRPRPRPYAAALAVGLAGTGFHTYNVWHKPGGFGWANLFYAAPLGAPAALSLAGLLGLAAGRLQSGRAFPARLPKGRSLCALAAIGLAGTSAEAALLHFRGAYHNPAMWLPVTVPPVGAALLAAAAAAPPGAARRTFTRNWLGITALLGVIGSAFHARGIARQMGGWNNWRQNVLSGPPLPAPPSFSALALAGWAALALSPAPPLHERRS
jgi:hypothetical protein